MRKIAARFRDSLTGLPPETIALILALGLVIGVFPVYGCPTILCAVVALVFRLNLPAIQLVNQVCSPLQLALLIPLGRAGERIFGHSAVWNLLGATRNAVAGWCLFCAPAGLLLYWILLFALSRRRRQTNALEKIA